MQGGMGAMEIVVVEEERETLSAVVTGVVGAGIGPLAGESLDEAFGLAIGLRTIGTSEEMTEAQIFASGGKEFGAIGGALVSEDSLDGDAVGLIKGERLLESGQDAGDFFIGKEGGKSQAGMIINGDVKGLDAGAWVAVGALTGGANARVEKAAQLFNIQMKELAWVSAFVADHRRLGRIECRQAVEAMALEDTGKGSFGDGQNHEDLGVGTALAAQFQDLSFEVWGSFAWLAPRDRGAIVKAARKARGLGAFEPLADSFIGDGESGGGGAERRAFREMMVDQFDSHERGESGISVHVDHEV